MHYTLFAVRGSHRLRLSKASETLKRLVAVVSSRQNSTTPKSVLSPYAACERNVLLWNKTRPRLRPPNYIRFAKTLANGGELNGARIRGLRNLQLMTMNDMPGFGQGFAVLLDPTRSQALGTPGEYCWEGAASTEFFLSPVDDLVAILMTQVFAANLQHRFDRILHVCTYQTLH